MRDERVRRQGFSGHLWACAISIRKNMKAGDLMEVVTYYMAILRQAWLMANENGEQE
jgi:hypothetical protein